MSEKYNNLEEKPKINGKEINGDMNGTYYDLASTDDIVELTNNLKSGNIEVGKSKTANKLEHKITINDTKKDYIFDGSSDTKISLPDITDYTNINNKPQIDGVELEGNKSLDDINVYNKDYIDTKINNIYKGTDIVGYANKSKYTESLQHELNLIGITFDGTKDVAITLKDIIGDGKIQIIPADSFPKNPETNSLYIVGKKKPYNLKLVKYDGKTIDLGTIGGEESSNLIETVNLLKQEIESVKEHKQEIESVKEHKQDKESQELINGQDTIVNAINYNYDEILKINENKQNKLNNTELDLLNNLSEFITPVKVSFSYKIYFNRWKEDTNSPFTAYRIGYKLYYISGGIISLATIKNGSTFGEFTIDGFSKPLLTTVIPCTNGTSLVWDPYYDALPIMGGGTNMSADNKYKFSAIIKMK